MNSLSPTVLLVLAFTLTSCNWNPFHRMYSATAEIQILLSSPGGNFQPPKEFTGSGINYAPEFHIMQSSDVLIPVVQKLNLDRMWAKRLHSDHDVLTSQEALRHFNEILKLDYSRTTGIVKITASSEVPQEAADIANTIAITYKTLRDREEEKRRERSTDTLREQVIDQQQKVTGQKAKIELLRQQMSGISLVVTSPNGKDPTPNQLAVFQSEQQELVQQQSLLDALNLRLKQDFVDNGFQESPVRILTRADAPPE